MFIKYLQLQALFLCLVYRLRDIDIEVIVISGFDKAYFDVMTGL